MLVINNFSIFFHRLEFYISVFFLLFYLIFLLESTIFSYNEAVGKKSVSFIFYFLNHRCSLDSFCEFHCILFNVFLFLTNIIMAQNNSSARTAIRITCIESHSTFFSFFIHLLSLFCTDRTTSS